LRLTLPCQVRLATCINAQDRGDIGEGASA
jgi:hypothetical protein